MAKTSRAGWKKSPADSAPRCEHCRGPLVAQPLTDWQLLNHIHPIPGVFSTLFAIEMAYGNQVEVLVCLDCFCFQPFGVEHPIESHGILRN